MNDRDPQPPANYPTIGGSMANRELDYVFLVDCSASMKGAPIGSLNYAIADGLPELRKNAAANPEARVHVRSIAFASGAWWHQPDRTPVADFVWKDLAAGGITDLGDGLLLLAKDFAEREASGRFLAPVIVLVTDGSPTDDWQGGLAALLDTALGEKAIRLAIAIGDEIDRTVLETFVGGYSDSIVSVDDPSRLVRAIRWSSTLVTQTVRPVIIGAQPSPRRATRRQLPSQRIHAGVFEARCVTTRRALGIRGEMQESGRLSITWAFPLPPSGLPAAATDDHFVIDSTTRIAEGFSCPHCANTSFARCSRCKEYSCCPARTSGDLTCAWCAFTAESTRTDDGTLVPIGADRGVSKR
jgi:uncharacterized protein YegL